VCRFLKMPFFQVARAKDMAKLARRENIPPECKGEPLGYFEWVTSTIGSIFSGGKIEE